MELARKSSKMMKYKKGSKSTHFLNVYERLWDDTRGSFGDSLPFSPLYVIGNSGLGLFFLAHGPTDVLPPQRCKHFVRAQAELPASSVCGITTTTRKRRGSAKSSRISEAEAVDGPHCHRCHKPIHATYSSLFS